MSESVVKDKPAEKTTQQVVDLLNECIGKQVEVKTQELCSEGGFYHPIQRDITYKGRLAEVDRSLKYIRIEDYTLEDNLFPGLVMNPKIKPESIEGYPDYEEKGKISFEKGYQRIISISSEGKVLYQEKDLPKSEIVDEEDSGIREELAKLDKLYGDWSKNGK